MSEVKICTYKQVDRVLSKLQKDITDLRKDKNIYNDKQCLQQNTGSLL